MRTQVGFRQQQQQGVPQGSTEEEIVEIVLHDNYNLLQKKIYVGVGKDMRESVNALKWALQISSNYREETLIILLHVQLPLRCIPTPMGRFPVNQVNKDVVKAYVRDKKQELNNRMQKYLDICTEAQVKGEILFAEKDDVAKGIVEVILEKGIEKLIMGTTSAGSSISRRMRMRSRGIADYVQKRAMESNCEVSIVCKDKLVLRRQGSPVEDDVAQNCKSLQTPWSKMLRKRSESCTVSARESSDGDPQISSQSPSGILVKRDSTSSWSEELNDSQRTFTIDKDSSDSESRHSTEIHFDGVYTYHTVQPQPQGDYQDVLVDIEILKEQLTEGLKVAENVISVQSQKELATRQKADAAAVKANYRSKELLETLPSTSCSSHNLEFCEYTFHEIKEATSNFSEDFKLGEGGYGIVYKGEITQTTVAIKILRENTLQGRRQFEHEIDILRDVRHPHLVRLVGACFEQGCVIYEYMSNGSLAEYLSSSKCRRPLPWQARIRIAAEICSALQYLHSLKPDPVVHRDLKPENILLDENYMSKIGDFGLARPLPLDSHSESEPKGTFCYMDPEYLTSGQYSTKSDVYSMGIVILELLTGKAALGLVKEVKRSLECKKLEQILDPSAGDWPFAQASQLVHLALQFTYPVRNKRPELQPNVMKMLNQLRNITVPTSKSSTPVEDDQKGVRNSDETRVPGFLVCPILKDLIFRP